MSVRRLGKDTTSVDELVWNGVGFGEPTADALWTELSSKLRAVALAELDAGNIPGHVLRNESRQVTLLSFRSPPLTPEPLESSVKVHYHFNHGNYCYDGTLCTYEDLESGDFLAFDDPNFEKADP